MKISAKLFIIVSILLAVAIIIHLNVYGYSILNMSIAQIMDKYIVTEEEAVVLSATWRAYTIGAYAFIVPIIVGIIALVTLDKVKEVSNLKFTAIMTLIFCSIPAGIIMLCMKNKNLQGSQLEWLKSSI